jgi:hypothetical protein
MPTEQCSMLNRAYSENFQNLETGTSCVTKVLIGVVIVVKKLSNSLTYLLKNLK